MIMNRKKIYTLVAILIAVGIYFYEEYQKDREQEVVFDAGKIPKKDTNTYYLPTSTTGQVVHHGGYSLSYSEPHEQAEWVAYELKKSHLVNTDFKRPYFEIDEAVKTGAAHWRNYKNSGYDRGHLCPAGDRKYAKALHDETFLTSNISPQKHEFNAGIWNRLEHKVRYWAKKYDGVYVVTGGVFTSNMKTIGSENVAVPNRFYKVLLDNMDGKTKMLAFLLPHKDSNRPLYEYVVSVDEIEKLTGIDFFPQLDDKKEDELEASNSYKGWGFR